MSVYPLRRSLISDVIVLGRWLFYGSSLPQYGGRVLGRLLVICGGLDTLDVFQPNRFFSSL